MKTIINTPEAPAPIGPYSQAVKAGNMLFVSGQIAIHPPTGEIISTSIEEETHQVMKNLKAALAGVGLTFNDVAKTNVLLADMGFFLKFNAVYAEYF